MDTLRRIGYSDKVFFYKPERNLRIKVALHRRLDLSLLKEAVSDALTDLEEFRVMPVVRDGEILYAVNNNEVAFFPLDNTERYFGSSDVNGYLFYILYEDDAFMLSLFHGLTDFKGMWALLTDIIYRYAVKTGLDVPDIRIKDVPGSDQERYDPYSIYADASAVEVTPDIGGKAFRIPCDRPLDDLHVQHEYTVTLSASAFLAKVREWNSSASCALAAIISNSIAELYDAGDCPITLKITSDMRPLFDSHTRVNMSEAFTLVSREELRRSPMNIHCRALTTMMRSQTTRENYAKLMAAGLENSRVLSGETDRASVSVPRPELTYVLTYPGRMDLPEGYGSLVKDFELKGYFPVDTVRFTIKSTGDELRVGIDQVFDGDEIIKAIAENFERLGFTTSVRDEGRFGGDRYSRERLKVIG